MQRTFHVEHLLGTCSVQPPEAGGAVGGRGWQPRPQRLNHSGASAREETQVRLPGGVFGVRSRRCSGPLPGAHAGAGVDTAGTSASDSTPSSSTNGAQPCLADAAARVPRGARLQQCSSELGLVRDAAGRCGVRPRSAGPSGSTWNVRDALSCWLHSEVLRSRRSDEPGAPGGNFRNPPVQPLARLAGSMSFRMSQELEQRQGEHLAVSASDTRRVRPEGTARDAI